MGLQQIVQLHDNYIILIAVVVLAALRFWFGHVQFLYKIGYSSTLCRFMSDKTQGKPIF